MAGSQDVIQTGVNNVKNAANAGQSAINSFDPSNYSTNTMNGINSIINGQNTTQNNYQQAFKAQIANQPSATDYYKQGMDTFNVQPLQQRANTLANAVLNAPNSNLAAARGFNVDQNQVDQKTSQDLQRLEPAAQAAQNNATTAQNNAMTYANNGIQQNQMNIMPLQEQGQYLMQQYAQQITGWTQSQQAQLQALQDKMDQGVALNTAEMTQYSQLAQKEQDYQSTLASANAQMNVATIQSQNQVLPQGATYYNPVTGKAYNPFATPARAY